MSRTVCLAAMALLMTAAPGLAQISPQVGETKVGADTQFYDSNSHTLTYDGKVEILQAYSRLRCDHAVVVQTGDNGIASIEAAGNVYYVTKASNGTQNIVRGDKAVYTKASDTIVITGGQVILVQDQNVMVGTRLVVQVSKGITAFDNPVADGKGRIRGVFYPAKANP